MELLRFNRCTSGRDSTDYDCDDPSSTNMTHVGILLRAATRIVIVVVVVVVAAVVVVAVVVVVVVAAAAASCTG